MTRVCRTLGILAVTLALSAPARAETIVINSGFLEWIRPAGVTTIQLAGDGFTFSGIGRTGIFEPLDTCGVPDCVPGATVDLHAYWIGSDLPGTATYNGTTFTQVGGFNSNTSLGARWTGSLQIPSDFSGGVLTAPFQFVGEFFYPGGPLNLVGAGQSTLNFTPFPSYPGAFRLDSIRYEFDTAAPVPEPTSMLLIGTGLAGLAALRRRRARTRDFES